MNDKKVSAKLKRKVESDLKNYPFWLLALECSELGYPTKWGEKGTNIKKSFVESSVFADLEKQRKVDTITGVLKMLDSKSRELVEKWYFRDMYKREELLKELKINKNKFYLYKDRALKKFMIALEYI